MSTKIKDRAVYEARLEQAALYHLPYEDEELLWLHEHRYTLTLVQKAEYLMRTYEGVRYAQRLAVARYGEPPRPAGSGSGRLMRVTKPNARWRDWSTTEATWLAEHYYQTTMDELRAHLGRSRSSIYHQAHRLGLVGSNAQPPEYLDTKQIAARYGVGPFTVSDWIRRGWLRASRPGLRYLVHQDELERFDREHADHLDWLIHTKVSRAGKGLLAWQRRHTQEAA